MKFIQTLRPAGLVYDPFGGAQFIDWYLAVLEYYKRIGVPLSQIKWTPPVLKQLLKILKDPTSKLKISLWLEENRD